MPKNRIYIPTFISSVNYAPARVLPHIYFYNGMKACETYYIQGYGATTGSVVSREVDAFPYFDNYEGQDPQSGSRSLLFFNEPAVYGTTPTGSLYTDYWEKYISLLYNPRTRLFNCEAIIPLADYFKMELNDIVQWRGNYYHLRAINDYNLKNGECKIQLLGPVLEDVVASANKALTCLFDFDSVVIGTTTTTTPPPATTTTLAPTTTTTLAPTTTTTSTTSTTSTTTTTTSTTSTTTAGPTTTTTTAAGTTTTTTAGTTTTTTAGTTTTQAPTTTTTTIVPTGSCNMLQFRLVSGNFSGYASASLACAVASGSGINSSTTPYVRNIDSASFNSGIIVDAYESNCNSRWNGTATATQYWPAYDWNGNWIVAAYIPEVPAGFGNFKVQKAFCGGTNLNVQLEITSSLALRYAKLGYDNNISSPSIYPINTGNIPAGNYSYSSSVSIPSGSLVYPDTELYITGSGCPPTSVSAKFYVDNTLINTSILSNSCNVNLGAVLSGVNIYGSGSLKAIIEITN